MQASVTLKKSLLSLCFFALSSTAAFADANPQGGTIHFVGQIVESPCNVSRVESRYAMSCDQGGHTQTRYFSPQELANAPKQFQQIASMEMHYLDADKKLAVMNIDYH